MRHCDYVTTGFSSPALGASPNTGPEARPVSRAGMRTLRRCSRAGWPSASAIAAASASGRVSWRVSIQAPSAACSRVVCRIQRDSRRRRVAQLAWIPAAFSRRRSKWIAC